MRPAGDNAATDRRAVFSGASRYFYRRRRGLLNCVRPGRNPRTGHVRISRVFFYTEPHAKRLLFPFERFRRVTVAIVTRAQNVDTTNTHTTLVALFVRVSSQTKRNSHAII